MFDFPNSRMNNQRQMIQKARMFHRSFNTNQLHCKLIKNLLLIILTTNNNNNLLYSFYSNDKLSILANKYFPNVRAMFQILQNQSYLINTTSNTINIIKLFQQQQNITLETTNSLHQIEDDLITKQFQDYEMTVKNEKRIKLILDYKTNEININDYRQVIVKYGQSCQQIIKKLKTMSNLQILRIQWNPLGKQKWIEYIIQNFKNLIELHFECSDNQFRKQWIQKINEMQKLQKLFYGMNIYGQSIQYFSQCPWFLEANQILQQDPIDLKENQLLIQKIPNLCNIWIGDDKDIPSLLKRKQWKHISIGQWRFSKLTKNTWQAINQLKSIQSLTLRKINYINNNALSQVISKNWLTLNSLMLLECTGVTQKGVQNVKYCTKLKSLYLFNTSINGSFLQYSPQFTYLYLRIPVQLHLEYCQQIKPQSFHLALKNICRNLEYLTLSCNQWMQDTMMQKISNIISLKHLNLCNNYLEFNLVGCRKITDIGFHFISQLSQLRSLHVGYTRISSQCLIQMVSQLKCLQKLGLFDLSIIEDHLKVIGQNLPLITHLDLRYCKKIDGQSFCNENIFPFLMYINIQGTIINTQTLLKNRPKLIQIKGY